MGENPGLFFEDVKIGHEMESPRHVVTREDILSFAKLSRDETPLHVDDSFAAQTPFGGIIAHGLLGLALIEGLKSRLGLFDRSSVASLSWDRVQFRKPIYPGDEVHVRWSFIRVQDQPGLGRGLVVEQTALINQNGVVVTAAQHTLVVRRRDAEA